MMMVMMYMCVGGSWRCW